MNLKALDELTRTIICFCFL